jgi:hypothetical protein
LYYKQIDSINGLIRHHDRLTDRLSWPASLISALLNNSTDCQKMYNQTLFSEISV